MSFDYNRLKKLEKDKLYKEIDIDEYKREWEQRQQQQSSNVQENKTVQLPMSSQSRNSNYGLGNIDLNNRPIVKNSDGTISTVRSMSFQDDSGKEILIPTVVNGRIVSDDEAISHYYKTGEYLGKFNSIDEANRYAEKLHNEQEALYAKNNSKNIILPIVNQSSNTTNIKAKNEPITNVTGTTPMSLPIAKKNNNIISDIEGFESSFLRSIANLGINAYQHNKRVNSETINDRNNMLEETENELLTRVLKNKGYTEEQINEQVKNRPTLESIANNSTLLNNLDEKRNIVVLPMENKLQEWENANNENIQENIENASNPISKKVLELTPSIAQSSVNLFPGGSILFAAGITQNYYEEAKEQKGMSDKEASKYASIMGTLESATEMIGAKLTKKIGTAFFKENAKKALQAFGLDIGENFLEEAVMEPLGELTISSVAGKEKADWNNIVQRSLQAGLDGALTSILMGGASAGVGKAINVTNKITNGQSVTQTEIKEAIKDIQDSGKVDVEKALKESISETIKNNKQNLQQNQVNQTTNPQEQQTISQENKIAQNGNVEQINSFNGYTEKEIQNIKSDKISIAESNEDISKFVRNSKTFPGNFKMYLGKVKQDVSSLIKNTLGINVDNYNISLKTDSVRKVFKDHGSETTEAPRGQVPITENDFLNIPNIINNPDSVTMSGETQQEKPVIKFEKNIDGNNVVVTYVSDKHNNLELQTMYKFKNNKKMDSATALHENQTPGLNTSEMDSGTNPNINNIVPSSTENVNTTGYSMQNEQNNSQNNQITNEVKFPITPEQKARKHYKSIIESNYTTDEAKTISKQLMNTDTYVPESNAKQLETADRRIEMAGVDSELNSLMSRAINGGNIKADDIAVGERLIQYYSKTGDKAKLQEAIQATAMAGTTAGQTVQAMSLLNHQTPEGQAVWLQRSVDKMNSDLKKNRGSNAEQFNLTPEMVDKIVNSADAEELNSNLDEVYNELGQQVSKTTLEKIDAWRYFCMLANPRTHIRNITGNVAMAKVQTLKNKVAGAIEGVASQFNPEMERTHTIFPASQEVKQFAKNDIKNVADRLELNDNKYNPKTRLENSMRTFKSDAMENTLGELFDVNDKALEAEDGWGLKAGYTKALSEYMTANKLTPDNITDKQLAKARNYAVEQAKEATFHQTSALASALNQFSNKNKFTKFIMDAILPFKKTPINVAKAGVEYSPVGLAKSAIYDTAQLRKGNITVNQYIDNISKGLTGTGIAVLGYALANAGVLKASGSDDKDKEKYDQDRGSQTYSIQIGDNTYSLDWLAPSGIPLFIGAECYEIMKQGQEVKSSSSDEDTKYNQAIRSAANILDSFTNTMNPMTEMSMLSGLTSALKSYDGDNSKMLANLGINATNSYVNQFIPTALGQIAKTTDKYERSTTSTKTGTLPKAIDSTKNYAMSKIPGLRQMLPTKTDVWGKDLKQSNNVIQRTLENAVLPYTRKKITTGDLDKELTNIYNNTGDSSVLPDSINKNLTIDKQKYVMTSNEYAKYKKEYGENSYELLSSLIKSTQYKQLTDEQKKEAIEKVYEYAKEQIKVDYAKKNNLNYEESKLSQTVNELKKSNANVSNYFEYLALTKDLNKDKEKIDILVNSSYSQRTKEAIYENSIKKDEDIQYEAMKSANIDVDKILKYKQQDFESDREDDGTLKGKSLENKKEKVVDYLNSMDITDEQWLLLYAMQKYSMSNSQKSQLANYIYNLKLNEKDKLALYSNFSGFTVYKDGTIKW